MLWKSPAAACFQSESEPICSASTLLVWVPSPSFPEKLNPHDQSMPSSRIAIEWVLPAVIPSTFPGRDKSGKGFAVPTGLTTLLPPQVLSEFPLKATKLLNAVFIVVATTE